MRRIVVTGVGAATPLAADVEASSGEGIDFVANQARPMEMDYAISNGFGFGGVNASALFRRWTGKLADASAGGSHH